MKLRPNLAHVDALLEQATTRLSEVRQERDRARSALERIANSCALVRTGKRVPPWLNRAMEAVEAEAREGLK